MAQDGSNRRGHLHVIDPRRKMACNHHRRIGFANIEQERHHTEPGAAGTSHIGGANVAAPLLAYVRPAEEAHQYVAEGDGA